MVQAAKSSDGLDELRGDKGFVYPSLRIWEGGVEAEAVDESKGRVRRTRG